jgi:PKD repeat protein
MDFGRVRLFGKFGKKQRTMALKADLKPLQRMLLAVGFVALLFGNAFATQRDPLGILSVYQTDSSFDNDTSVHRCWTNCGAPLNRVVCNFGGGGGFVWDSVNFGTGVDYVKYRYCFDNGAAGTSVPLCTLLYKLDSPTGSIYAKLPLLSSGGGCTERTDSANVLTRPTGFHRVFIMPTNNGGTALSVSHGRYPPTAPSVVISPQDTTIDAGGGLTLRTTAMGAGTLTYQWTKIGGGTLPNPNGNTLALTNVTAQAQYICTVTNTYGSSADTAMVRVRTAVPVLTVSPATANVLVGANVTLQASATGTPTITYKWARVAKPDSIIATTASLTLTNAQLADSAARFRCIATNAIGSDTAEAQVLVFTAVKAKISVTEPSTPVNVAIALRDSSTGSISQWKWSFGDGTRDSTYTTKIAAVNHTFAAAGTYTVKLVVTGKNNLSKDSTTLSIITYVVGDNPLRITLARPVSSTKVEVSIKYVKSVSTDALNPPYASKIDLWYGIQGLRTGPAPALDTALASKDQELDIATVLGKMGTDSIYHDTVTVPAAATLSDTVYGFWVSPIWNSGKPSGFNIANAGQAVMKPVNALSLSAMFLGNTGTVANPVLNPAALDSATATLGNLGIIDTNAIAKVVIGYGMDDYTFNDIDSLSASSLRGSQYIWGMRNPQFKEDTQRVYVSLFLIGKNGLISDVKKTTLLVGWLYPANTSTLTLTDATTYTIRVNWTAVTAADSVRIIYGKTQIPLGKVSEMQIGDGATFAYHALTPANKTDTTLMAMSLEIKTTYWFAIQIMKNLHWSDVTPGGRGSLATRDFAPEDSVPNTARIDSAWFESAGNTIRIRWHVGSWNVPRVLGINASTDATAVTNQPSTSLTNSMQVQLDTQTNQGESVLNIGSSLQFGATYHVALWLRGSDGPWATPTDSSKRDVIIPSTFSWQRISYFSKDTVTALNGNFLMRKDSLYNVPVTNDTVTSYQPASVPAGMTVVSIGASLKKNNLQSLYIGLRYDPAKIPAGFGAKDIGIYRDSSGIIIPQYGFSVDSANVVVWAQIPQYGILQSNQSLPFIAMVDQTHPAVAITSDTTSAILRTGDLLDTIVISDNVSNVKWWINYAKDGERYQTSSVEYASASQTGGDTVVVRVPAKVITEDNGVRAFLMISDGVHMETINISRQALRAQSDGAYIEPYQWTPVWTTANLDNKNVKTALRQLVPDGHAR